MKVEAVLEKIKGDVTPQKIINRIQKIFGVPIREGYAKKLRG